MNNWFEWKNQRCTALGIHVLEQPAITLSAERVTFTDIPGKSGSLTRLEGDAVYDDLVLTAECMIENETNLTAVTAYLQGSGQVTFANRPGGYYEARIINQIPFEKILRGKPNRRFGVNFRCKPFFYFKNVQNITVSASGTFVTNPGNVFSEPIITVNGSGEATLMVGMTITELNLSGGSITLNTPLMEAYNGNTGMNGNMSGDFPTFLPGRNAISWTGNITSVVIQPRWRGL